MRTNAILEKLLSEGQVSWKPVGNSMTPKILSGDQVFIKKCDDLTLFVGDIVYVKVKGNYYLHLISAIKDNSYQISNNHGHVNGWVNRDKIYGLCTQVKEKILISEENLASRR